MTLHQKHTDPKPKFTGIIGKVGHHILTKWDTCNTFHFLFKHNNKNNNNSFLMNRNIKKNFHEHKEREAPTLKYIGNGTKRPEFTKQIEQILTL